ncbi:MAG: isoprenylcysteine carboxylmethyltransferase family protein [Pseudomonadota bacterium]
MHIPPPLIAVTLGIAMKLAANATPMLTYEFASQRILAFSLVVAGLMIAFTGVAQFRKHRTTVNPLQPEKASSLVTDGIFKWTRNPMYLGLLMILLAWAVWLGNGTTILIGLCLVPLLNKLQIIPEETALLEKFGQPFQDYLNRTRRWL